LNIEDKIKGIKIDDKLVAWKIFQIPSLAANYKSFSNLREEIGIDSLTKGSFLNKADEVHYNKKNLIKSYSSLFPNNNFYIKLLQYLLTFQNNINGPYKLFKMSLDDEALFCYLFTMNAIYIDKHKGGIDDNFERIAYSNSDLDINLFSPSSDSDLMPFLNKDKWGFKRGDELVIDCIYDYVEQDDYFTYNRFGENDLAPVCKNKLFGFINKNGELIIDFQYSGANEFNNGFAVVVNIKNKEGVIDSDNKVIIDFKYDEVHHFNDDLYIVKLNEKYGLVNTENIIVLDIDYDAGLDGIINDRALIIKGSGTDELWGFIDSKGKIIIEPIYFFTSDFDTDLAVATKYSYEDGSLSGVIDKEGSVVIPFQYDEITIHELVNYDSLNMLITACKDDKWGIIYMGGTPLIPAIMNAMAENDFAFDFEEDILGEFKSNLKENQFKYLQSFSIREMNDEKKFKRNLFGFRDFFNEEEVIIEAVYDNFFPFANSYCVAEKNEKYGIINLKGEVVIDFIYDYISNTLSKGYILVKRANKFFYLDENGNELASNL
jgi:hypothetical protein